jgi:hypothetical protein
MTDVREEMLGVTGMQQRPKELVSKKAIKSGY